MTLVLSLVTHDHLIQASDRRFVSLNGKKVIPTNDYKNKAVCWRGRMAFAFTGLAELGPERRTDRWLANAIWEAASDGNTDHRVMLQRLTDASTTEFAKPRIRRIPSELRRHAFVVVGWARFVPEADTAPYTAYVSNFHVKGKSGIRSLASARPEFEWFLQRLAPDQHGLLETLNGVSPRRLSQLIEHLADVHTTRGEPGPLIDVMVDAVRKESKFNQSVGRGVLINVLPRSSLGAAPEEFTLSCGVLGPDMQSFLYAPRSSTEPKVAYGPTVVGRWGMISDFRVTSPDGSEPPAGAGVRFDREGFGLWLPAGAGNMTVEGSFTPRAELSHTGEATAGESD